MEGGATGLLQGRLVLNLGFFFSFQLLDIDRHEGKGLRGRLEPASGGRVVYKKRPLSVVMQPSPVF